MGCCMETSIITFIEKFLANLFIKGIKEIPCSGDDYENGISAMQGKLEEILPEEKYDLIADLFVKEPVVEEHIGFIDKLFELNGKGISFSSIKNPYWTKATIEMQPFNAYRIVNNSDNYTGLSNDQYEQLAVTFCTAARI